MAWALNASAQTHCADLQVSALAHGQWQLATARDGGDVLRYDSEDKHCEVPLQTPALAGPQILPDAEQSVLALRDGRVLLLPQRGKPWPWKQLVVEGRTTAMAVSAPGQPTVIAVATAAPLALTFLNASLQTLQRLRLIDKTAQHSSPICRLLVSPQRQSFVAVFPGMAELWELSYNPLAAEIGLGMVHDFQYREGHFVPGYLNPLRTSLPWNVAAAGLDSGGHMLQLHSRATALGSDTLVIHLDVRKPVTELVRTGESMRACEDVELLQK